MQITDLKVYKIISKLGLIDLEVLDVALKSAKEKKEKLATFLIKQNLIKSNEIGRLIAHFLKVQFVDLSKQKVDDKVLKLLPEIVSRKQKMIVFGRNKDGLKVAMNNPLDYQMIKSLEKKVGDKVNVYFATEFDIINSFVLYRKSIQQEYATIIKKRAIEVQGSKAEDVSVIKLVNDLFSYAYTNHASDIHIEPIEKEIKIRFRIDGILYDVLSLPKTVLNTIISRIKILAKLRTDETRQAQDGKVLTRVDGDKLDIRVSVVPTTQGEKTVMRLLSAKGKYFDLSDLGMNNRDLSTVKRAIKESYGMILSTGPTGSGKTTSLYALIKILNNRNINICTIEDPVEYELDGINQIQVDPKTNVTFSDGLKSILRQDPDIIMVGEIRDSDTASIAVNSAMTGHLVLSTLHTNDAAIALPRLLDMKIEPFLVASTVNVVIAQRLVRKICMKCIVSFVLAEQEVKELKHDIDLKKFLNIEKIDEIRFYKGKGCKNCNNSGYTGRIGIFEVLDVEDNIKDLILIRSDADKIKQKAVENGMTTMLEDGFTKAVSGITTIEEVLRVIKSK